MQVEFRRSPNLCWCLHSSLTMKSKLYAAAFAVGICSYMIYDYLSTKYDRLYRLAAGESVYEKTHVKKKHK